MKVFVSYVLQRAPYHSHHSEVIDILSPPYTYSPHVDGSSIMDWVENKREKLEVDQQLIVLNYFKL